MEDKKVVVAFDIYGTVLDHTTIGKELEQYFEKDRAQAIASAWRKYQLEYTWRLNSMGRFVSFLDVTRNSLEHALADTGTHLGKSDIPTLMMAHDSMKTFPDVDQAMKSLTAIPNISLMNFTNGTRAMVTNTIVRSRELTLHAAEFQKIVSVEEVKKFKPAPEVYKLLADRAGKREDELKDIWLVSANPFDIVGALNYNMRTIWVDRRGTGWRDGAIPSATPTAIVNALTEVVNVVQGHYDIYK